MTGPLLFVLDRGPLVAGAMALAITPGMHVVLALGLERRVIRPRDQFLALIYGDPLLCLACGVGVALVPRELSGLIRSLAATQTALLVASCWLVFGIWQWRSETRLNYYSLAQALAPTKIWHQLAVYPVFGTLVTVTAVAGLGAPLGDRPVLAALGKVIILGCGAGWILLHLHDRRHPRLGHPPFDWRRLRPVPRPWPADSISLRATSG
ncbi:hypothetical protein [Actinocrispum wychmicini]|uniref:Uncharacterized protein n=1 Tax=Actinocrispum wychmicini TaxID=1213861 RepID=A0A4R2JPM5_9PSEU|nr:hypothetical protein [Actinocrispum wychmicini]TCO62123.1 hypothetical protein EV192_102260 [Actinocrispum wychmicini]